MKIEATTLLQKLIQCKTITPEDDGIVELTKNVLTKLGFMVKVIEFKDENSYPVKNIYAKLGYGQNCLSFCGHLDVVHPGNIQAWSSHPFEGNIVNDSIIGRGCEDMKGGIACFISAISNILSKIDLSKNSIIIMLTLDEEALAINGIQKLVKYVIEEEKQKIDGCLLAEPTCTNYIGDCIKIGRRGSLNFTITVNGKQGHVAYPGLFNNPINITNKLIKDILNLDLSLSHLNFEPTNLEITSINTSTNVYNIVPMYVKLKGNIRFNPCYTLIELQEMLNKVVKKYTSTFIEFSSDHSEPFITSDKTKLFLSLKKAIIKVTNKEPTSNTYGGTSDARFIKKYIPVLEFGLIEKTLHQIDESVKLKELELLTNIYISFIQEFCNIT